MDKYTRGDCPPRKVPDRDGNQEAAAVYGRVKSESGAGEPAKGDDMRLSKKQERFLSQLEELWNFFDARLKNYSLKTSDLRLGLLLTLTVAAHRLIRGFLAQLRGGSNDNLQSKLRTLTEALINVNYILSDDTDIRAKAFVLDSMRSRKTALYRIIGLLEREKAPSMAAVNTIENYRIMVSNLEQELLKQQNLLGKENASWPPIEQRAAKGNSEELYATVFVYFSQHNHITVNILNRFLKEVSSGIAFTTELDLSSLDQEIQTAFAYYLIFINICSEKLRFPTEEELKEFNNSEMLSKE